MASMNEAVAALLREYAELSVITGGDPFRVRNYERAAKSIAGYPADIAGLSDAQLRAIPGVGKSIAGKITEFRDTGSFAALPCQTFPSAQAPTSVKAVESPLPIAFVGAELRQ